MTARAYTRGGAVRRVRRTSTEGAPTEEAPAVAPAGSTPPDAAPEVLEPQASDDAVDTWHDETRPVPVVPAEPSAAVEVPAAPVDEAVIDGLSSWFRDEPGARSDG